MRFTFYGHAAFLIETAGLRIITDPYSSRIGYRPINESADIVTVSHDNPVYHSCLEELKGDFTLVEGMNILETGQRIGGVDFSAIEVFEKLPNEGPNAMVLFQSEGIRVLHMGDCGPLPSNQAIAKCGRVDVLLALAGGSPTISLADLMTLVEKLQPRIVVPMHFGVPQLSMSALPPKEIESLWHGPTARFENGSFEVAASGLPKESTLYAVSPTRLR